VAGEGIQGSPGSSTSMSVSLYSYSLHLPAPHASIIYTTHPSHYFSFCCV
jgi:hypothetical protein